MFFCCLFTISLFFKKKKIRNTTRVLNLLESDHDQETTTHNRPTHSTVRKCHKTPTVTGRKTIQAKQPAPSSSWKWLQNLKGHKVMHTKTRPNREPPQSIGVHKTMNQQQQNPALKDSSRSRCRGGGLNALYWRPIFCHRFRCCQNTKIV